MKKKVGKKKNVESRKPLSHHAHHVVLYALVIVIHLMWSFLAYTVFVNMPATQQAVEKIRQYGLVTVPHVARAIAEILSPDAAGTYQEWDVTGAATHWQAVNDNSDTTYISTGVDEERDTQTLANVSVSTGFVQQVDVVMKCIANAGGGAAEAAATFIREGGIDTAGSTTSISRSAYTEYTTSYTTNPRTTTAWTMSEVNSLEAGVRLKTIGASESVRCSEIYVTQNPATAKMSAYRWFANANSTDVGSALAAQDTSYTLTSAGQAFRLRLLMHVASAQLNQNSEAMTLQFATKSGTCDTLYSGESWSDVTAATVIAFNDNATPTDGATLTTNANDPSDTHTKVTQTYEELNNFQNSVAAVPSGQDGIWDFSLKDNSAPSGTSYCFRVIKSDDNVPTTPTVVPEINTIDTIAPTITNVSSDKANGSYKAGEVIDIDVTFSEAVTSTGNVTVTLETGVTDQTCTFTVSNATTGTCNYTVQAGDTSADLTVSTISGTIKDQALNAMTNFVPATNLAANKALVIDTTAPTISATAPATSASINSITSSSDVSYTLSEAIASGSIVMTRTSGTADASSPHTCTLKGTAFNTGAHTGFDMSDTTNGCTVAQSLVSGTVYTFAFDATDVAGNAATQVSNTGVTFDSTAPTVSTLSPADNATGVSTTANLVMTFSETVAVNGTGSSGPSNGGTFADDATVGTVTWTSPSNAQTSNDVRTQARFTSIGTSHYLKATNFGFAIPNGSTITGITAEVERSRKKPVVCLGIIANAADSSVKIVKGGTISGNEKAVVGNWPSTASEAYATYGGSSDLWGLTWTPADINASTFGFVISATSDNADSSEPGFEICADAEVDHIRLTVSYTRNVVIKKTADNSTVETIAITSGQVTGTGTNTITVNPSVTLAVSTEHYVQVDAGALQDSVGNDYAGIADTTSWSFTTTGAGPTYVASGSLTSSSIDTTSYPTIRNKNLLRSTWSQTIPTACTLTVSFRGTSAGGATPDYTGVLWQGPYSGTGTTVAQNLSGNSNLQNKRYYQYKVDMTNCNSNNSTPELFDIQLEFD